MTRKLFCRTCTDGSGFPLFTSGFSRRRFFRVAGTGVVGSYFADVLAAPRRAEAATSPRLLGTARNAVLVFLGGGPSHTDTFDLKEGTWTPKDFDSTTYLGGIRFPRGLMPKLGDRIGNLAFVRTGMAWAAVHSLAQTWTQIARKPSGPLGNVSPHIGAVVALETEAQRKATDVLPGFLALNAAGVIGPGYFPSRFAPFSTAPGNGSGLASLKHPDGASRLANRWGLLRALDSDRTADAPLGKNAADMDGFYGQAKTLIDSPDVSSLFTFTTAERTPYGPSTFGDSLLIARKVLAADRGTRFVQVNLGGWDQHGGLYAKPNGIYATAGALDAGLGAFLADLEARPGVTGGSLLDETLVIVVGEFGRTVGAPNSGGGRDHFQRMSIAFAGGGVRGGRVIGQTDERGDKAKEYGWKGNRDVRPEDVTCTLYSALGIDYTTVRHDDPIGRGFEYVPLAGDGVYLPIDELF